MHQTTLLACYVTTERCKHKYCVTQCHITKHSHGSAALAEDTVKTTTATAVTETSMLQPFASLISGLLNYMGGFSDSQVSTFSKD
jgi:hypothetical protein